MKWVQTSQHWQIKIWKMPKMWLGVETWSFDITQPAEPVPENKNLSPISPNLDMRISDWCSFLWFHENWICHWIIKHDFFFASIWKLMNKWFFRSCFKKVKIIIKSLPQQWISQFYKVVTKHPRRKVFTLQFYMKS